MIWIFHFLQHTRLLEQKLSYLNLALNTIEGESTFGNLSTWLWKIDWCHLLLEALMWCSFYSYPSGFRVSFLFFENPSTSFQAMSFIGSEGRPAPKLKDAVLSDAEVELVFGLSIDWHPVVRDSIIAGALANVKLLRAPRKKSYRKK